MIHIDPTHCTGCASCAKVCPHQVIAMRDKKAYLAAEDRCIECGACQLNCHEDAVVVSKGTGCIVAIAREIWFNKPASAGTGLDAGQNQPGCGCG
jgi:ferredoxin